MTAPLCLAVMPRHMILKLSGIPDEPVCLYLEGHDGDCYAGYGLTPWRKTTPALVREDSNNGGH